MPVTPIPSHPVLTPEETRVLEAGLFRGEERLEWRAMQQAGAATAAALRRDYAEAGTLASDARLRSWPARATTPAMP